MVEYRSRRVDAAARRWDGMIRARTTRSRRWTMSVNYPENNSPDVENPAAEDDAAALSGPPTPRKIRIGTERDPDARVENRAARLYPAPAEEEISFPPPRLQRTAPDLE